jgi:DNA-binding response OmpR family regulator
LPLIDVARTMDIPASCEYSSTVGGPSSADGSGHVRTPTYTGLVIEDYRSERLLLKRRLHRLSFHVLDAADGRTAIRRLSEGPLDLVCVDLMLPDMSGLQICEYIRRSPRHSDVPILVISARALPEDRADAEQAGASSYLVKPFVWKDFDAEVSRLLALPRARKTN